MVVNYDDEIRSIDFMRDSDNVYRIEKYIVKQRIVLCTTDEGDTLMKSMDTFYVRTWVRDMYFDIIFEDRNFKNGKRMHTASYTRTYVD